MIFLPRTGRVRPYPVAPEHAEEALCELAHGCLFRRFRIGKAVVKAIHLDSHPCPGQPQLNWLSVRIGEWESASMDWRSALTVLRAHMTEGE